ncbi:peptidylprolyl isomerase [Pseudoxanthomonas dokdonensis]|uniref:peptidylprolyl isomerase n=1 Tax=Pseudoxanthomonas dokdonensis TaxID=344882 RepID=A0A0R0CNG8_9GAMM|nr:peptidylprolyl isomerase [Pseudoxanthomonas dokdonensis]KRG67906.1 peptidylprolyl isomerase [Pseudoxanthomonas dokdonensis]
MSLRPSLLLLALGLACPPLLADAQTPYKSAQEILKASPDADWRTLDPANTLYMELPAGRVIIELAPRFAPAHVGNIRTLAHEGYWNGLGIYRSQDNFVVQFGDSSEDENQRKSIGSAQKKLPAEFERDAGGLKFDALPDSDGWAPEAGFVDGFPAARDPQTGKTWLAHCYGTLGAGRDTAPDSSNGTELYVVTGQAPRQLDRNITVVGRVVQGMELLSVIPRGPEPMGFYDKLGQATPITAIHLASDVAEAERTPLQVLRTDSRTFSAATEARRNRRDGWYVHPAGHIDLCNVPLPVRPAKAG